MSRCYHGHKTRTSPAVLHHCIASSHWQIQRLLSFVLPSSYCSIFWQLKLLEIITADNFCVYHQFILNKEYYFSFKEREENVKADIFHAYVTLLKQTKPTLSNDPDAMEQEEG